MIRVNSKRSKKLTNQTPLYSIILLIIFTLVKALCSEA